jgi:hypothetical protein
VYQFQDTLLPDLPVDLAAVVADLGLPALLIDLLQDSRPPKVIDSGFPQALQKLTPLGLCKEDLTTVLADVLENRGNVS